MCQSVTVYNNAVARRGLTGYCNVVFDNDAVETLARIAEEVNNNTENIGARRLYTLMERLLEDILFEAPEVKEMKKVIDKTYVEKKLKDIKDDEDLSRYIL